MFRTSLTARPFFVGKSNSTTLSSELKQKLATAREVIESEQIPVTHRNDAIDSLGKLAEELQKPQRDEGRLKRLWENIKAIAPAGASILASSVELAKIFGIGS